MKTVLILTLLTLSLSLSGQTNNLKVTPDDNTTYSKTYLIKARNQIIGGFVCEVFGTGIVLYGVNHHRDYFVPNDIKAIKPEKVRNMYVMGGGALCLMGVILEIVGVDKFEKAGVSLDENGIGLKFNIKKFKKNNN
jgi:hypothetical protein